MNRKPIYCYWHKGNLYINLTTRCTLACTFCPKRSGDYTFRGLDLHLNFREEPKGEQVINALEQAMEGGRRLPRELVFAGLGEPTIGLDRVLEVAAWFKKQGYGSPGRPNPQIRLITDGLANLRQGADVTGEMVGLLDVISVSLNAGDPETYADLCPSPYGTDAYGAMLDFIRLGAEKGLSVVASVVAPMPGVDVEACARIIGAIPGAQLRVRTYEPDGFGPEAPPE